MWFSVLLYSEYFLLRCSDAVMCSSVSSVLHYGSCAQRCRGWGLRSARFSSSLPGHASLLPPSPELRDGQSPGQQLLLRPWSRSEWRSCTDKRSGECFTVFTSCDLLTRPEQRSMTVIASSLLGNQWAPDDMDVYEHVAPVSPLKRPVKPVGSTGAGTGVCAAHVRV